MLDGIFSTECETAMQAPGIRELLSLIGEGEENAVHARDLSRFFGLEEREIRRTVERLRRSGAVIASSQNGYYFPSDARELGEFVRKEERRAKSVFYTLRAARRLLKEMNREAGNDGTE